jgi:hypothetical protein
LNKSPITMADVWRPRKHLENSSGSHRLSD